MLMECSILLMGSTVKWQGGDINTLNANIVATKKITRDCTKQRIENEMVISQIVWISKLCGQNGERIL